MTDRGKNILTGLTVLISLAIIGWLIVAFTGLPQLFRTGNILRVYIDDTYGIKAGDPVYMLGRRVGIVTDVEFNNNDPMKGVVIRAKIDADIRLRKNVRAEIFSTGLMGRNRLNLILPPETEANHDFYPLGKKVNLVGTFRFRSQLPIPDELTDALEHFGTLANSLNKLIGAGAESRPASLPADDPGAGLQGTIARMNRTLDSIYAITGDIENRKNLSETLKGLKQTTATADQMMAKLIASAEKIDGLVMSATRAISKIESGKGSASRLLNDPELYNGLVDSVEQMEALLKDLRDLVDSWKADGVKIKLK